MSEMDEKNPASSPSAGNLKPEDLIKLIQNAFPSVQPPSGGGGGGTSFLPGSVAPGPGPNINFNPLGGPGGPIQTAPPRQGGGVPATGSQSIGNFKDRGTATNAGLVSLGNSLSGIFNAVGQKEHAKKAAMAENYLLQINGLLASGDPKDREKAMMILEDPKIRKTLKTGLDYVPLEEEKPPEAQGVESAVKKIQAQGQPKGGQPPPPQKQPMLPQPSTQQKIQQVMQNALLQKLQQDPASAISMMGGSQLTGAEQRASEFYEKGLGLSPNQVSGMNLQEKLTGMKVYESMMRDALKFELDKYKADKSYEGKVDSAKVLANSRKYWADQVRGAAKDRGAGKGVIKDDPYAKGAKMYEDMAKKYLDMAKAAGIKPEDKTRYEGLAEQYNRKADEYLNQANDQDLMQDFMKAVEGGDDASGGDTDPN